MTGVSCESTISHKKRHSLLKFLFDKFSWLLRRIQEKGHNEMLSYLVYLKDGEKIFD